MHYWFIALGGGSALKYVAALFVMICLVFVLLFSAEGPSGTINFTVPSSLVLYLSGENETLQGSDAADFLSDFVIVSKAVNGGNKSLKKQKC